MPELIAPHVRAHRSFLAAAAELQEEGPGTALGDSNTAQAVRA